MSPRICKSLYPSLVRLSLVNKKVAIPASEFGKGKSAKHILSIQCGPLLSVASLRQQLFEEATVAVFQNYRYMMATITAIVGSASVLF